MCQFSLVSQANPGAVKPRMNLYTQRNLFEILLNQPEIRLYLTFSDWFGSKWTSVWIQINRKIVNTIWFRFDLIRFWKYFSVCITNTCSLQHVQIINYSPKFLNYHNDDHYNNWVLCCMIVLEREQQNVTWAARRCCHNWMKSSQ